MDSPTFPEMVDFLGKLMVVDPENRMTSMEALRHPWLNTAPYVEESDLKRLQKKVMTEEELAEVSELKAQIETSSINALLDRRVTPTKSSKSPVLGPSKDLKAESMASR